ncbi:hypothetical protein CYLTODRAFT_462505, partial [Cylindrobasidium torrendii FP15055 ss-10]
AYIDVSKKWQAAIGVVPSGTPVAWGGTSLVSWDLETHMAKNSSARPGDAQGPTHPVQADPKMMEMLAFLVQNSKTMDAKLDSYTEQLKTCSDQLCSLEKTVQELKSKHTDTSLHDYSTPTQSLFARHSQNPDDDLDLNFPPVEPEPELKRTRTSISASLPIASTHMPTSIQSFAPRPVQVLTATPTPPCPATAHRHTPVQSSIPTVAPESTQHCTQPLERSSTPTDTQDLNTFTPTQPLGDWSPRPLKRARRTQSKSKGNNYALGALPPPPANIVSNEHDGQLRYNVFNPSAEELSCTGQNDMLLALRALNPGKFTSWRMDAIRDSFCKIMETSSD